MVTLAALINALYVVTKDMKDLKVVFNGVGASGVATSKIFMEEGVTNIIGCDRAGAIYRGRTENMNFMKDWYASNTNPNQETGTLLDVIEGADVFVGLSGPGTFTVEMLRKMNRDPIVFAMANPVTRNHARRGGSPCTHHGYGAFGLPESDQQRAGLSGHLQGRSRLSSAGYQ